MTFRTKLLRLLFTIALIIPLLGITTSRQAFAQTQFTDVESTDFGFNEIIDLYERGVVTGLPGNKFQPDGKLTRADAAVMFQRALELPIPSDTTSFKDVKQGLYYTGAVAATKEANIFKGNSNGTFGPYDQLSREQMASLLVRVLDLKPITSASVTVNDSDEIHPSHRSDVFTLYHHGITKGKSGNMYDPKGKVTRAEFSVFVVRSLGEDLPAKVGEEKEEVGEVQEELEEGLQEGIPEQPPITGGSGGGSVSLAPKVSASHLLTNSNERIEAVVSGSNVTYTLPKSKLTDLSIGKITVSKDVTMTVKVIIAGVDINEERTQQLTQGENDLSIANTISRNAAIIELLGSFTAQGTLVDQDGNSSNINLIFNINE